MEVKRVERQQFRPSEELEGEDEEELALMSEYDELLADNEAALQQLGGQLAAQSKRKEKARIAARARRSQEATIIMEMAAELQITQDKMRRIDKATIVKLAIDYIRAHEILCQPMGDAMATDGELLVGVKNSMMQQQQLIAAEEKLTQVEEEEENVLEDEEKSLMNCLKCGGMDEPAARSTMGEIDSNCNAKNMTRLLCACCASLVANEQSEEDNEEQAQDSDNFKEKQIAASNREEGEDEEEDEENNNEDDDNLGNEFKENRSNHQQSLYSAPKLSTASIFAPKTDDNMNSFFLMIEEKANGKSQFILKPDTEIHDDDDLTHLAPQAGGMSISFETDPLDGIPIDDLLVPSPPAVAAVASEQQRYHNNITSNVCEQNDEQAERLADELHAVTTTTSSSSSSSSSNNNNNNNNFDVYRRMNSLVTTNTRYKGAPIAIPMARPRVTSQRNLSACLCVGPPTIETSPTTTTTTNLMASQTHRHQQSMMMIRNCIPTRNQHVNNYMMMHMPIKPSRVSGSTSPPMKKLHWATSLDDDSGGGGTTEGQQHQQDDDDDDDDDEEQVEGVNEEYEDNDIRYHHHQHQQQQAHNERRRFKSLYHNSNHNSQQQFAAMQRNRHTQFATINSSRNVVNQYRPVNFVHQQQQQQQRLI